MPTSSRRPSWPRRSPSVGSRGCPLSWAPSPRDATHSSPVPKSRTKAKHMSPIVGPSATPIDSARCGKPRLALREPSSGSTTTRRSPPPNSTSPRSSERAVKRTPSRCSASSSSNTACSAWASISSVRSPPSPRSPVSTTRSAMVGCSASMSLIASAARRAAPSQSGVMWGRILGREVPTAAQHEAVTHARGPLLVVGAAGTGKTTTLVERFAWLAAEQAPAESILALTFGDAAAAELRDRVEERLPGPPPEEPSITTFEGFCARLLREEALEAGLDPFATPVSAADRLAMLLERIDDLPLRHHDLRGNPSALLGSIVRRIDLLKRELVTCQDYAAWASTLGQDDRGRREREFAELFRGHDRLLAEAGTLDSGDLVL